MSDRRRRRSWRRRRNIAFGLFFIAILLHSNDFVSRKCWTVYAFLHSLQRAISFSTNYQRPTQTLVPPKVSLDIVLGGLCFSAQIKAVHKRCMNCHSSGVVGCFCCGAGRKTILAQPARGQSIKYLKVERAEVTWNESALKGLLDKGTWLAKRVASEKRLKRFGCLTWSRSDDPWNPKMYARK